MNVDIEVVILCGGAGTRLREETEFRPKPMVNIGVSTLRGVGAVLILWLIAPTIQAFFSWQIITSSINTYLLAFFLWHSLQSTEQKATLVITAIATSTTRTWLVYKLSNFKLA